LVIVPVCAYSDRIAWRPVFILSAVFTMLFAFPLFWLVNKKVTSLILLGMGVGGLANGASFGVMVSFGPEPFKTGVRYTGASLGYHEDACISFSCNV